MDKYKSELINNASKLDSITDSEGQFVKHVFSIVDEDSRTDTILLLKKLSNVIDNPKYKYEIKHLAQILNSNLIEYYGYITLQKICKTDIDIVEDKRTLQELLGDLNNLVGLKEVKSKVNDLITYQKIQMLRIEKNLHSSKNTLHLAFTGNPGTGKTTVARIVGRIYKQIGLLSKGHFIEVSRTDLIAGYQGQTALKVKKVIENAKGGVLFIDEAYSITENEQSDSYGRECITELTKALEDYREDLVVIVAGYTEPMNNFFESNPGLKSRFNTFIQFENYQVEELDEILVSICNKNDYQLSEDARENIKVFFSNEINKKNENFANGRLVRNIYDDLVMNHAKRVAKISNPSIEDLSEIKATDFEILITKYINVPVHVD